MNNNIETINFDDFTQGPKEYNNKSLCCSPSECKSSPLFLSYGASVAVSDGDSQGCHTLGAINQFNIRALGLSINEGKVVNLSKVKVSKAGLFINLKDYSIDYLIAASVYTTNDVAFEFSYDSDKFVYKKVIFDILEIPIPDAGCNAVERINLRSCSALDCLSLVEIMLVGY